jgi:hypothetical protein
MNKPTRPAIDTSAILEKLAQVASISQLDAVASRFVYSLRLIALHERVKRDPVPELTMRLGGVDIAARTLGLSHVIASVWPENVHVSPFCCQRLTHDEATIGALLDRAWGRDRNGFEQQVEGLVRPERVHRLWDATLALVQAELRAT